MANLAFLGLGAMGAPMAARLADAGHAVTVWNRTRSRAEAIAGAARVAESPADAAAGAEAAITMLATPDAVRDVVLGPDGVGSAIAPGAPLIDMSTIGPDHVAELASAVPDGVEVIDVPVLGGVSDAVEGSLTLYFGASEAAFARWKDVLGPMGRPIHVGPPGAGQALKLVANSTLAGLMSLAGEALALADALGLDEEVALAALLDSPIGPAMRRKLDKIESNRYAPSFSLSLMRKDVGLVGDAAGRRDVALPVIAAATRWIERADDDGLGDLDYSAVVAAIRGREATG
jgi:3-hydroxyisobutyrate dehydrogenase-like beta-hydroxyacid dehydrogenase